jgi:MoaA/NifB/PqqE/SkfB family radical SAM enzyme
MAVPRVLRLARDIARANVDGGALPYRVQVVATYHCNFRCEMCSIWQKKSVDELTPEEVGRFFRRSPHFTWVNLTGGELFMRRDFEEIVLTIIDANPSLYLLNFPTTGWFGDRAVALAGRVLRTDVGRLMMTISIDGPQPLHDDMRGLRGSWVRGIDTFRRLRGIRDRRFQAVIGMTLFNKNATQIDATISAIQSVIPDFDRSELHLNIGHESPHYFGNNGYMSANSPSRILRAIDAHRAALGRNLHPVRFLEDRYQALVASYYEHGRSPLPCTALASSCLIDPYWNVYPCLIWDRPVGNLRDTDFDLPRLWTAPETRQLRREIENEQCPHCWTPCEAYPAILGNLPRAVLSMRAR